MKDVGESVSTSSVLSVVEEIFNSKIAFNRLIGLDVSLLDDSGRPDVKVIFSMRPELIGNFARGILHGGVISSALDVVGGLAVYAHITADYDKSGEELTKDDERVLIERFSRLSTIDLRVDFLRPGVGSQFETTAQVLRIGSRVGVVRMDLRNDLGDHIAAATATYSVSQPATDLPSS